MEYLSKFEKGKFFTINDDNPIKERNWNPHPQFEGVYLKHLITGSQTDNMFSSHIVHVEPNCILDEHIHEGKTELHEIISGSGVCRLEDKEFVCFPGDCTLIPQNKKHKVIASKDGLIILAKFFPALI